MNERTSSGHACKIELKQLPPTETDYNHIKGHMICFINHLLPPAYNASSRFTSSSFSPLPSPFSCPLPSPRISRGQTETGLLPWVHRQQRSPLPESGHSLPSPKNPEVRLRLACFNGSMDDDTHFSCSSPATSPPTTPQALPNSALSSSAQPPARLPSSAS